MKKTTIVLQAYGAPVNLNQNIFCLLSLLYQWRPADQNFSITDIIPEDVEVVVYTDQAETFEKFFGLMQRLRYEDLSPARVKAWRGAIDFVHRVKVEMLKDAAQKYPRSTIFYVDGDTFFLKNPAVLFAGIDRDHSWMHERENIIGQGGDPISKKLTRFLRRNEFKVAGETVCIPTSLAMWNAGVLGFAPDFTPHIANVLTLTEELYSKYPKHVMEQLAFSYYLQKFTQVHDSRDVILHYWRQKDAYNLLISRFLDENPNSQMALKNYGQFIRLPEPAIKKTRMPIGRKISEIVGRIFAQ